MPRTGHWPSFAGIAGPLTQLGPLARRVDDLALAPADHRRAGRRGPARRRRSPLGDPDGVDVATPAGRRLHRQRHPDADAGDGRRRSRRPPRRSARAGARVDVAGPARPRRRLGRLGPPDPERRLRLAAAADHRRRDARAGARTTRAAGSTRSRRSPATSCRRCSSTRTSIRSRLLRWFAATPT